MKSGGRPAFILGPPGTGKSTLCRRTGCADLDDYVTQTRCPSNLIAIQAIAGSVAGTHADTDVYDALLLTRRLIVMRIRYGELRARQRMAGREVWSLRRYRAYYAALRALPSHTAPAAKTAGPGAIARYLRRNMG